MRRFLPLLVLLVLPGTAPAPDIYKAFLDETKPNHRAIKDTLALIEKHPDDGSLYNDLGCLIAWDGFWRDALRNFDTAAKLSPKDSKPHFNAGLVEAWRGKWSSARSRFHKAVKVNPGNWPGWWMLGYSEEQLGDEEAAVDAYKRSLRVDTSLFDVRRNPFAATTRLKARVFVETYGSRMIRAALPQEEQFEDHERIARFFQTSHPVPAAPPTPPAGGQAPAASSGAVVTTVPHTTGQRSGTSTPPSRTNPRTRAAPARPPTPAPEPPPASVAPAGPGAFPVPTPTPEPEG
jgi:hypothetical protein